MLIPSCVDKPLIPKHNVNSNLSKMRRIQTVCKSRAAVHVLRVNSFLLNLPRSPLRRFASGKSAIARRFGTFLVVPGKTDASSTWGRRKWLHVRGRGGAVAPCLDGVAWWSSRVCTFRMGIYFVGWDEGSLQWLSEGSLQWLSEGSLQWLSIHDKIARCAFVLLSKLKF